MIGTWVAGVKVWGMKLSDAQYRAVDLLAGEEGWARRGTIQQKTMDVLVRLDMVEMKRDESIHVTMYRATQNAYDWLRGQQDDGAITGITVGARVAVEHEGTGTVTGVDETGVSVRIDHDGVIVEAAVEQVSILTDAPKTSVPDARVTAEAAAPVACGECGIAPHDLACGTGIAEEQDRTGVHAGCGLKVADHCAYCDVCPTARERCDCDPSAMIGEFHGECGLSLDDHCSYCDECPRTPGPCWCRTTGPALVDDEPVTIVAASQGPLYAIDFGSPTVANTAPRWVAVGGRRKNGKRGAKW